MIRFPANPPNYYCLGDYIPDDLVGSVAEWEEIGDETRREDKLFAVEVEPVDGQDGRRFVACVAGNEIFLGENGEEAIIAVSPKRAYTLPVCEIYNVSSNLKLLKNFREEIWKIVSEENSAKTEDRENREARRTRTARARDS